MEKGELPSDGSNPLENETPKNEGEKETPEKTEGEETPETPQEEKPEGEKPEKSKELQSALAQKDHWRKKAEDAEKQLSTLKKEKPPESASEGVKDEWKSKVEFLLQNQEAKYSEEEFDHIAIVSTQQDVSLDEAAKQEDEYIQFKREKVADKNKIPASSSSGGFSEKSEEDIRKMSEEDFKKYLEEQSKKDTGM